MHSDSNTLFPHHTPRFRSLAIAIVWAWILIVNLRFFGGRLLQSRLVQSLSDRLGS